jgi:hypothetical protein
MVEYSSPEGILQLALDLPDPQERTSYLDKACANPLSPLSDPLNGALKLITSKANS